MLSQRSITTCIMGMCLLALALPASASLQISLGVRETAAGGGPEVPIGGNAGSAGGIEWINQDGQTVPFDGQWHLYTWEFGVDPVTPFAGGTANGILEGAYGSLEHLRFLNDTGVTDPITIWIDLVVNTIAPGPVTVQNFEGFAAGAEVMFQEPSFSGSTSGNVLPGGTSLVDDTMAYEGIASYRVDWTFVDGDPTRWLRLTTFNTPNGPNPLIRFDQGSQVSMYVKAIPEPASALLLVLGALAVRRR